MIPDYDVLVIGAGAAGASAAILLAEAGWRAVLVEQHAFPRRKVCGECIAAGNLPLLDNLGVGTEFRDMAGPEIRQIGWMDESTTVIADMPVCVGGPYAYGRALGRDRLDPLLLERARGLGVTVLQPAKVRSIAGSAGSFACTVLTAASQGNSASERMLSQTLHVPVVIDAHGSWERGPLADGPADARPPRRPSDLMGFKATFLHSGLTPGFLPVLSLPGAYGGMVVGDDGRTTLACCIRRDALAACRASAPHQSAGGAVEAFLRRSCGGVRMTLQQAERDGPWLSVGPLRTGVRVEGVSGAFRVGNAAGESHPLIGEGISMALQSSALLAATLGQHAPAHITGRLAHELQRCYATAWRRAFAPRLRLAAVYAQIAMRPVLAASARTVMQRWPSLLGAGARLAGKANRAVDRSSTSAEIA